MGLAVVDEIAPAPMRCLSPLSSPSPVIWGRAFISMTRVWQLPSTIFVNTTEPRNSICYAQVK